MSRGPGRIERAIFDLFDKHPEGAWTTADLCRVIYPTANRVEKKHRVAVLRAMDKVMDKKGDRYRDWDGFYFGFNGAWARVLCNFANVKSYSLAKAKSLNDRRWRDGERRTLTEEELLKSLQPGGDYYEYVIPYGAWDRHVREYIAKRDGDQETAEKLAAEQERENAKLDRQLVTLAGALKR